MSMHLALVWNVRICRRDAKENVKRVTPTRRRGVPIGAACQRQPKPRPADRNVAALLRFGRDGKHLAEPGQPNIRVQPPIWPMPQAASTALAQRAQHRREVNDRFA